ncbi:OmpA family protein [Pontixanthobacter aquaemixtae]|uniref:OmpA family protein n=1 Tax=Pontixanthobacter aquaemixtae TaxID=1958940 RepID=A0A844ZM44_9SPHN|nr:OmpA family protein [Pontixanthobacter aquaemixtae]MXO89471.1 OmpA family protein [Pontixanthobacter aquaemixtae]
MSKWVKLLIGGGITSLLAWGSHAATGERFVEGLGSDASQALAATGIEGASVEMKTAGALTRTAILFGDLSDADRAKAEQAVLASNPAISSVVWASDREDGEAGGEASQAAVADCQKNVDEAIAGKTINFKSGSAYMPDSSLAIVTEVADVLKACEGLSVAVGGHTDATGSAEVNNNLSQGRADAVAAALTERGIAADRISAKGFGSSNLKVPGDGANEANRRIEFTVSGTAAAKEGE